MKVAFSILLLASVLAGCATSTVESRKAERLAGYTALSPEMQSLVNEGRIKIGMSTDAVYIAWGPPAQMLAGESEKGSVTTWIYLGTTWEEYRYWTYRTYHNGRRLYHEPYLDFDYYPRNYVSAEVVFESGLVKSWRHLQRPN